MWWGSRGRVLATAIAPQSLSARPIAGEIPVISVAPPIIGQLPIIPSIPIMELCSRDFAEGAAELAVPGPSAAMVKALTANKSAERAAARIDFVFM
ncbi:hypothetical protein GCM10027419_24740 [Pandoraea terrae]